MKPVFACLFAGGSLLIASSLPTRADEFSQIQNNPNTYWVSPSETGAAAPSGHSPNSYASTPPPGYQSGPYTPAPSQAAQASSDPKSIVYPQTAPPPPSQYTPPPSGYGYYAPGPYVYGPPPVYVAAPPRYYYYAPRPAYPYPYATVSGYYGGHGHYGGYVGIPLPGVFLGIRFH